MKRNGGKPLSEDAAKATKMWEENSKWINDVKKAGYDILDTGGDVSSAFYNMEKK